MANDKKDEAQLQIIIDTLVELLQVYQTAQKTALRRHWLRVASSESPKIPEGSKTLFVDNSLNGNAITINLDNEAGGWIVAANGSRYIPCENSKNVTVNGAGTCNILALNRDLMFGS